MEFLRSNNHNHRVLSAKPSIYSQYFSKFKFSGKNTKKHRAESALHRTEDNDVADVIAPTTATNSSQKTTTSKTLNENGYPSAWDHISKSNLFVELTYRGYFIKRRIGAGSYSKVYYAEQKSFQRTKDHKKVLLTKMLACKIIDRRHTSEGFYEKFLPRELDVLQSISHPHIVPIYSIFEMGPFICICMDFCSLGDLLERIRTHGVLSEKRAKLYFKQICTAIKYLHSMNISHRDIKCENVLIHNRLCAKLTDFGFSRRLDDLKYSNACKTFCGSTAYAAPEVLKGISYDPKLYDMWSLGCVLYIMLCGAMPYDDENILNTIKKQEMHIIDFPEKKFIDCHARNMISNLLHPDLKKRFHVDEALSHPWISDDFQKN